MDAKQLEQVLVDRQGVTGESTPLMGPVQVLEHTPTTAGGATYQVSVSRLVPVDEADPELSTVYVPVPITAAVEVDDRDHVVGVVVPDADPSIDHQARAFTRTLIDNGAVRGLPRRAPVRRGPVKRGPSGPPPRATHELTTDEQGRRVIRRTGYTTSLTGSLDGRAHDGTEIPSDSKGGTNR